MSDLILLPLPKSFEPADGTLRMPRSGRIVFETQGTGLAPALQNVAAIMVQAHGLVYRVNEARERTEDAVIHIFAKDKSLPPQGYKLIIEPDVIRIYSADDPGAFHAMQTLLQLMLQKHTQLPCMTIEDAPDLPNRGFMLDISRCKVPKLETLFKLIDYLALFKYNQFQLYMEHTFTFKGHQDVWKQASPLTPEELQQIDRYCRERFIDLVPNFNSFGHFERWLRFPRYFSLAECPKGFSIPELNKYSDHGTTLKPCPESLRFIKTLHNDLLPNFTSTQFNIGGDEPWELGYGASKERVEREGKHRVYIDFLKDILAEVWKGDKHPMFWADILLERADMVGEIPAYARPLVWGYDDDHPFNQQCPIMEDTGLDYYVAPGTSVWNSFTGRVSNMFENVKNAITLAIEHKATGMLMTSWGDNGNHLQFPLLYPGLVTGGARSWHNMEMSLDAIADAMNKFIFQDPNEKLAQALIILGQTDQFMPNQPSKNRSILFDLGIKSHEALSADVMPGFDAHGLKEAQSNLQDAQGILRESKPMCEDGALIQREIQLALDMAAWSALRGHFILKSPEAIKPQDLYNKLIYITQRYEQHWQARARPGGLPESMSYLKAVSGGLQRHINTELMQAQEKQRAQEEAEALKAQLEKKNTGLRKWFNSSS